MKRKTQSNGGNASSAAADSTKGKGEKVGKKKTSAFNGYWIIGTGIVINHILAVFTLLYYRHVSWGMMLGGIVLGFLQMLGITAGYHRLWSHQAFEASMPVKYLLSVLGAMSWQGSIRWWVLRHRLHHRFTDTEDDPYDATKGLWFSHFGWLFIDQRLHKKGLVDMSDSDADPVVRWNKDTTPHVVIGLGIFAPLLVGQYMGDALGGFLWVGVMARIISWNGIFAINSFAHMWGYRDFNEEATAATSLLCALLSNGEGNHSYHHEFPYDYRHGVEWYQYDPTKWFIWACQQLGLVGAVKRAPRHLIEQIRHESRLRTLAKEAEDIKATLVAHMSSLSAVDAGRADTAYLPPEPRMDTLPVMSMQQAKVDYEKLQKSGKQAVWLRIDDYLVDATAFLQHHPGGPQLLRTMHLKNATSSFSVKNTHMPAAQAIVRRLRFARIKD